MRRERERFFFGISIKRISIFIVKSSTFMATTLGLLMNSMHLLLGATRYGIQVLSGVCKT